MTAAHPVVGGHVSTIVVALHPHVVVPLEVAGVGAAGAVPKPRVVLARQVRDEVQDHLYTCKVRLAMKQS